MKMENQQISHANLTGRIELKAEANDILKQNPLGVRFSILDERWQQAQFFKVNPNMELGIDI